MIDEFLLDGAPQKLETLANAKGPEQLWIMSLSTTARNETGAWLEIDEVNDPGQWPRSTTQINDSDQQLQNKTHVRRQ